jgi:polyisoprenoid-binding protein YceI
VVSSFAAVQWSTQPKESQLTFVGTQACAPSEGKFEKFTADIKFAPKDLATSRLDVKIDMAPVNTREGERVSTLKGADLFSVKQYPSAQYVAEKFTDKGKGQYTAKGKLTLRNVTKDVPIEFTFEEKDTGSWHKGQHRSSA